MKRVSLLLIIVVGLVGGWWLVKSNFNQVDSKTSELEELRMELLNYVDYSEVAFEQAMLKGDTLLFFAATSWCQTCAELEKEILERSDEIPEGLTILKVDYDNDKVMNQKWGVTSQHTLVVLDKDSQEVKRWLGGGFDTLLQQLKTI